MKIRGTEWEPFVAAGIMILALFLFLVAGLISHYTGSFQMSTENDTYRFEEGQQLKAVGFDNCSAWYEVGRYGVKEIRVIMEYRERGGVPWALILFDNDRSPCKINLALCVKVEL